MSNRHSTRLNRWSYRLLRRSREKDQTSEATPVEETSGSPAWTNTAKLAVGLAMIAILALLVWRFRNIVSFLLLAVLLAYLLYPLTTRLRSLGLTWRGASMVVFLLTIIIVFGSLVWGGYALVTQSQSLISFIQGILRTGVPDLLLRLPSFDIGTFHFPPANLNDLGDIGNDLLGLVNPILSRTTSLLTGIASGTATFIGWTFFTLLVTYFIMAESSGIPSQMINFNIPGYSSDIRKFTRYLSGIWNAFLRGQLIIILITVLAYFILLSILGVRFALGLAIIAGMARFVPYVGPAVAWTSYGLVAFFQGSTILGLSPGWYVFLVVVTAWVTDLIMDNLVAARLMGNALKIHPAAIMVSALVAANLLGVVGVVLAAPVAATLKLMFEYLMNKLLDRDPWEGVKTSPPPVSRSLLAQLRYHLARLRALWQNLRRKQKTA